MDIEGDHLIPVVRNRRLYLFWPIFTEHSREQKDAQPSETEPEKYWEIQMAWSEYKSNKWSGKKISGQAVEYPNKGFFVYYGYPNGYSPIYNFEVDGKKEKFHFKIWIQMNA